MWNYIMNLHNMIASYRCYRTENYNITDVQ